MYNWNCLVMLNLLINSYFVIQIKFKISAHSLNFNLKLPIKKIKNNKNGKNNTFTRLVIAPDTIIRPIVTSPTALLTRQAIRFKPKQRRITFRHATPHDRHLNSTRHNPTRRYPTHILLVLRRYTQNGVVLITEAINKSRIRQRRNQRYIIRRTIQKNKSPVESPKERRPRQAEIFEKPAGEAVAGIPDTDLLGLVMDVGD